MDFLTNFLKNIVEGFRVKTPSLFAVLTVIVLGAIYVADVATRQVVCQAVDEIHVCTPLLGEALQKIVIAAERVLFFIAALLGVQPMQPMAKKS